MRIGFVTCLERGIVSDDALIADALRHEGVHVEPVFWDGGPPPNLDALVLRSPWNYHLAPERFLEWIDRAAAQTPVFNDPRTVRWNAHKAYLFEMQQTGIAIAPTVLCSKERRPELHAIMAERSWTRVIVKPAISASSFMTGIAGMSDNGQQLLDRILETRDALIQPFMPEVFERGERCLIFIDGDFSHAVQKAPFTDEPGGGRRVPAEQREIEIGELALSIVDRMPLYARVDLIRGEDGIDRLMEFELIDPELYMRFDEVAPRRFASAVLQRLG